MTKSEQFALGFTLSTAAIVFVWTFTDHYTQYTRKMDSDRIIATLAKQCTAPDGWSTRILLDSTTAQPYCYRFMDNKRAIGFVAPLQTVGVM